MLKQRTLFSSTASSAVTWFCNKANRFLCGARPSPVRKSKSLWVRKNKPFKPLPLAIGKPHSPRSRPGANRCVSLPRPPRAKPRSTTSLSAKCGFVPANRTWNGNCRYQPVPARPSLWRSTRACGSSISKASREVAVKFIRRAKLSASRPGVFAMENGKRARLKVRRLFPPLAISSAKNCWPTSMCPWASSMSPWAAHPPRRGCAAKRSLPTRNWPP